MIIAQNVILYIIIFIIVRNCETAWPSLSLVYYYTILNKIGKVLLTLGYAPGADLNDGIEIATGT